MSFVFSLCGDRDADFFLIAGPALPFAHEAEQNQRAGPRHRDFGTICAGASHCYSPQKPRTASWSADVLEYPSAGTALSSSPNCNDSAESVFPLQFALPGVPTEGTLLPLNEKVMLKVPAPTMS